mgnify:CR=1 FL=1|tara:strand:- start:664 stop:1242 length:579 start_codon:yes stop_codon:yes gene_type:complete
MTKCLSLLNQRQLEKDIKYLDKNEHLEILKIMRKHEQKYSENSKGVFFNLKYIDNHVISEIKEFVEFCKSNKSFLNNLETGEDPIRGETINPTLGKCVSKVDIDIEKILSSKTDKKNNFSFKNYLDKIAIVPNKEFKNKGDDSYPNLININTKFSEMNSRILKKCKSVAEAEGFLHNSPKKNQQSYLEVELH